MFKVILWDVDRTLLDFDLCERNSLKANFKRYNLGECTDDICSLYSDINVRHWKMLERGEITKQQVMTMRFDELFRVLGIEGVNSTEFSADYEYGIGDTTAFVENAPEIIASLVGKYKQYAVTNGALDVQQRRLRDSGLDKLFDGVFISDDVGFDKPSREYFDCVLSKIIPCDKSEIIIVGDSLTSDMLGGNNAGIPTCWYNPSMAEKPDALRIDYQISALSEIYKILEGKEK